MNKFVENYEKIIMYAVFKNISSVCRYGTLEKLTRIRDIIIGVDKTPKCKFVNDFEIVNNKLYPDTTCIHLYFGGLSNPFNNLEYIISLEDVCKIEFEYDYLKEKAFEFVCDKIKEVEKLEILRQITLESSDYKLYKCLLKKFKNIEDPVRIIY